MRATSVPTQTATGRSWPMSAAWSRGSAEVASVVDLDGHAVRSEQLEPMEGGVAHAGEGVAHDQHAGGHEAPAVAGGVLEHRQLPAQVDGSGAPDPLLGRGVGDRLGLDVGVDAPGQRGPQPGAVQSHGRLGGLGGGEDVADHGHVVVLDALEQQGCPGVVALHEPGRLQVGVHGARHPGQQPGPVEAPERAAEAGVEHVRVGVGPGGVGRGHEPSSRSWWGPGVSSRQRSTMDRARSQS